MDLDCHTTIAIAQGILLERYRISPAEATRLIADLARADGLSLADEADWLILTRWPLP
ncbi:ANTAR domain-containing protein [Kribbella sp. NPDC051952]|uniref:ANTAR domain-containing protein n=1 Tax=Kribbella sp. NPDC051952 TaxID=3154851 RepID=UPI00341749B1